MIISCQTCKRDFEKRSSQSKFCSRDCTPYLNKLLAYDVWRSMIKRCDDPRTNGYEKYGGRGVSVDLTWYSYEQFFADVGPRPSEKHQLDRKDNNGNYTKDNCHWVTPKENQYKKQSTRRVTFDDKEMSLSEWAKHLGLSTSSMAARIDKWPLERALTQEHGKTGPKRS